MKADLATCELRDTKGLYRRARERDVAAFNGISADYEEPLAPDLVIDTTRSDVAASTVALLERIRSVARAF